MGKKNPFVGFGCMMLIIIRKCSLFTKFMRIREKNNVKELRVTAVHHNPQPPSPGERCWCVLRTAARKHKPKSQEMKTFNLEENSGKPTRGLSKIPPKKDCLRLCNIFCEIFLDYGKLDGCIFWKRRTTCNSWNIVLSPAEYTAAFLPPFPQSQPSEAPARKGGVYCRVHPGHTCWHSTDCVVTMQTTPL